jgi:hypothetical protein
VHVDGAVAADGGGGAVVVGEDFLHRVDGDAAPVLLDEFAGAVEAGD